MLYFHFRFIDYFSNFAINGVLSLQICRLFLEFCYQRRAFTLDLSIISRILLPTACFHFRFVDYFPNFAINDVLSLQIYRLFLEFFYQRHAFTLDLSIISRILLPTACFHFRLVDYFSNFATNGLLSLQIYRLFLEFCYQRRAFTLDLSIISRILLPTACFHFRFVDYFSNFASNGVLSLQTCRLFLEFCFQCSTFTLDLSIISRILLSTACFHFRFVDYFSNFATNGVLSLQICRLFHAFCYQRRAFTLDLLIISRILLSTTCFHFRFIDYFSNFSTNGMLSLQICRLFLEFCYERRAFTLDLSIISRILLPTACFTLDLSIISPILLPTASFTSDQSIISRILLPTACFHFRSVDYFSNFAINDVLSLQICRLFLEFCYQRRAFTSDLSIISRILLPTACFHFRFVDYFSNYATNVVLSQQFCRLFLEFCYQRRAFTLDLPIISRILLPTECFHFRFADYFSNFATNDVLSLQIFRLFLEFCYQRRAFTSDLSIISRILLPTACFHFRFVDYFSNFATNGVLSLQICRLFLEFCYQTCFHFRIDYFSNFATNVLSLQICRLFLEFCYQRRAFTLDLSIISRILLPTACFTLDLSIISSILLPTASFTSDQSIISRILLPTACFHFRSVDYFSNFAINDVLSLQICRLFLEFCYQRRAFTSDLSIISRILLPTACFHFRFVDYFSNYATNVVLSQQFCRLFLEFCYQRRAFTSDLSIISRILLPMAYFHFRFIDYFSNFAINGVLSLQICRLFLEFCYQRRAFTFDLSIISRILLATACFHFRFVDYFSNFATNALLSLQIYRLFLEFCYQRRAFTSDLSIISRIFLLTTCFHFRFVDYFSNFTINGVFHFRFVDHFSNFAPNGVFHFRLVDYLSNFATNGVLSLQICRLFLEFCYQRRAFTLDLSIISRILLPTSCFHNRFVDYFSNFATNGVLSLQICRLFLEFCYQRRAFTLDLPIISRILLPTTCFHYRFFDYFSNFATNDVLSLQICRLCLEFCYQWPTFTLDLSIISRILLPTACFHSRFVDYFSNFATNGVLSLQICRLFLEFFYQRRAFTLDLSIISRILLPTTCFHFRFVDYFSNFATNVVLSLQICRLFLEFCYQRRVFTLDLSIISRILLPTACFHFRLVDYFTHFATNGVLSLQVCRLFLEFCYQRRAFTLDLSIISRILLSTACFHFRFVDYFSNFATNGVFSLQICRLFLEFCYQRRAFTLDLSIISRIFLPTACFHFRFVDYFSNFATNDVLSLQICRLFLEFYYQRRVSLQICRLFLQFCSQRRVSLQISRLSLEFCYQRRAFTLDLSIISRIMLPTSCFHNSFVDYFSNFATNGVLPLEIFRLFLEFCYQRRAFTSDLSIISRILLPMANFHFRFIDYFSNFAINGVLSLQICRLFLEFCYQRRAFTLDLSIISRILLATACFHFRLVDYFSNFATNALLSLQIC